MKELSESFFNVYEFYLHIFDNDENVEIETVSKTKQVVEKKLGNTVDVGGVAVLAPFVSQVKEPEKATKKK